MILTIMPMLNVTTDPFQLLPVELMLFILQYIDDFYSLHALAGVSPYAKSVCMTYAVSILNHHTQRYSLFCSNESLQPKALNEPLSIRGIFRSVALLLSEPSSGPETPKQSLVHLKNCARSTSPIPLSQKGASELAFKLIHIIARIQRLACLCLLTMSANLNCALLNSAHFGPKFTEKIIPFSWVEEYRVYRALWSFQLDSIYRLHTWKGREWDFQLEELKDVCSELHSGCCSQNSSLVYQERCSVSQVLVQLGFDRWNVIDSRSDHFPLFDFDDMEQILNHNKLEFPSGVWTPRPRPNSLKSDKLWKQDPYFALKCQNPGAGYWGHCYNEFWSESEAIYQGPGLPLLQGMGIFIWDLWRLFSAGIMPP